MRKTYPSKNNCQNCQLSENPIQNSSKKQKDNKIAEHQAILIKTTNLEKRTKSTIFVSQK